MMVVTMVLDNRPWTATVWDSPPQKHDKTTIKKLDIATVDKPLSLKKKTLKKSLGFAMVDESPSPKAC